jgi:hypothetical protein
MPSRTRHSSAPSRNLAILFASAHGVLSDCEVRASTPFRFRYRPNVINLFPAAIFPMCRGNLNPFSGFAFTQVVPRRRQGNTSARTSSYPKPRDVNAGRLELPNGADRLVHSAISSRSRKIILIYRNGPVDFHGVLVLRTGSWTDLFGAKTSSTIKHY